MSPLYGGSGFHKQRNYPYNITVNDNADVLFVTLEQARDYLKITSDDIDDADLTAMILAVSRATERYTKLTLYTTTFTTTRDLFDYITLNKLKRAPLISIGSIQYLVDDSLVTIDSSIYKTLSVDVLNFGSIALKAGNIWPVSRDEELAGILITFDAGMATDQDSLQEKYPDLIQGMLRMLADFYTNRGDCNDCGGASGTSGPSSSTKNLLAPFRIMEI